MKKQVEGLFLAYIHPGELDGNFHESLLQLLADDHKRGKDSRIYDRGGHIGMSSGPRIAAARNDIVRHFLKFNCPWLLMVDSDMVFNPAAVDKIMEAADAKERPLVGGLCFGGGRSGIMFPTLYRLRVAGPNEEPVEVIKDYPPDQLCKVDATGAAFLLMHRDLLVRMEREWGETPYPWFIEGSVYKGMTFGEDWAFCLRAKQLGYPLYVHTGVKIGHAKKQILDEEAYFAYREREDEIGANGVQEAHRSKIQGPSAGGGRARSYAVIPQKDKLELTDHVVEQLLRENACEGIFVMDNGSDQKALNAQKARYTGRHEVTFRSCAGRNIHQMWNEGVAEARTRARGDLFNVAILNNDLDLGPHFIKRLASALRADSMLWAVCPNYDGRRGSGVDYVRGTYPSGMSGFAFMLKGEAFDKPFDEEYQWWYGDTDFAINVMVKGYKVGMVFGCKVEHLDGGSQTAGDSDRDAIIAADKTRFFAKWEGVVQQAHAEQFAVMAEAVA
jgi:GT2 family glycosyltransferase